MSPCFRLPQPEHLDSCSAQLALTVVQPKCELERIELAVKFHTAHTKTHGTSPLSRCRRCCSCCSSGGGVHYDDGAQRACPHLPQHIRQLQQHGGDDQSVRSSFWLATSERTHTRHRDFRLISKQIYTRKGCARVRARASSQLQYEMAWSRGPAYDDLIAASPRVVYHPCAIANVLCRVRRQVQPGVPVLSAAHPQCHLDGIRLILGG